MHLKFGGEQVPLKEAAWDVERILIADRFGWPLSEIDNLSQVDVLRIRHVLNAIETRDRLDETQAERAAARRRKAGRRGKRR